MAGTAERSKKRLKRIKDAEARSTRSPWSRFKISADPSKPSGWTGAIDGIGPFASYAVPQIPASPLERERVNFLALGEEMRKNLPAAMQRYVYEQLLSQSPAARESTYTRPTVELEQHRTQEVTGGRKAEYKETMTELGMGSRRSSAGGE